MWRRVDMKGIELFSDIFMLLVLMGVATAMTLVVLYSQMVFKGVHETEINIATLYSPLKYSTYPLAFLELTDDKTKLPVKRILTYVALEQKDDKVYIDGHIINAKDIIEKTLSKQISDPYLLRVVSGGKEFIYKKGTLLKPEKLSAKIFLPSGQTDLEFYVG